MYDAVCRASFSVRLSARQQHLLYKVNLKLTKYLSDKKQSAPSLPPCGEGGPFTVDEGENVNI